MSMNKDERLRHEGARWALDRVKEMGLEQADAYFRQRGAVQAPLAVAPSELKRFEASLKHMCMTTICCLSCLTLHDEYGFSTKRLRRFINRFNKKVECLEDDWSTWSEYAQILWDECRIDVDPLHEFEDHDRQLREAGKVNQR